MPHRWRHQLWVPKFLITPQNSASLSSSAVIIYNNKVADKCRLHNREWKEFTEIEYTGKDRICSWNTICRLYHALFYSPHAIWPKVFAYMYDIYVHAQHCISCRVCLFIFFYLAQASFLQEILLGILLLSFFITYLFSLLLMNIFWGM
jgi:hypothetical protein